MADLKKSRETFVKKCQSTAQLKVNQPNAIVQVEFTVWADGDVKGKPEITQFIFPPASPEQQLEMENAALRLQRDTLAKQLIDMEKQIQFLRLEATK